MQPPYCRVFHALKLTDCWMTPFIRIANSLPRRQRLHDFLHPFQEQQLPVTVQLLGNELPLLLETVKHLTECGIAGINLNFACPSRKVMRKGNGGGMLRQPEQMTALLSALREQFPQLALSVKLRVGYQQPDEMEQIIPACCRADIDFIVLHYRTVVEGYRTIPDGLERLKRGVELAADIPVIGSGDIFTPAAAEKMRCYCGVAGVVAGRGLLRDPWLIRRIQGANPVNNPELFFSRINEYVKEHPKSCSGQGYLLELAKNLWGLDSEQFYRLTGRPMKKSTISHAAQQQLEQFFAQYPQLRDKAYLTSGNRSWQEQLDIILSPQQKENYPNIKRHFKQQFNHQQLPESREQLSPDELQWWREEIMSQAGRSPGFPHVGGRAQDISVKQLTVAERRRLQAHLEPHFAILLEKISDDKSVYGVDIAEANLFHLYYRNKN